MLDSNKWGCSGPTISKRRVGLHDLPNDLMGGPLSRSLAISQKKLSHLPHPGGGGYGGSITHEFDSLMGELYNNLRVPLWLVADNFLFSFSFSLKDWSAFVALSLNQWSKPYSATHC